MTVLNPVRIGDSALSRAMLPLEISAAGLVHDAEPYHLGGTDMWFELLCVPVTASQEIITPTDEPITCIACIAARARLVR